MRVRVRAGLVAPRASVLTGAEGLLRTVAGEQLQLSLQLTDLLGNEAEEGASAHELTAQFDDGPKTGIVTITTVTMVDPAAATVNLKHAANGRPV